MADKGNWMTERQTPKTTRLAQRQEDVYEDDFHDEDVEAAPPSEHKVFGLGIPNAEARQPAYGQGVVVSVLTAGAVLLIAIISIGIGDGADPPLYSHTNMVFWLVSAVTLILAGGGAQYAERTASSAAVAVGQPRAATTMATAWAVPFVATFAAIVLVATFQNRAMLVFGPLITFLGTSGSLLSRDLLDEADEQSTRVASVIHTIVVHGIAFLAFSGIYLNKLDSWVSVPLTAAVGGILILESLERGGIAAGRRIGYALLGAWVLGQATLALNWWPTYGWTGGAVLLVAFYVAAGLMLVYSQRQQVTTRDLIEFGGVGGIFLVLLAVFA